MYIFAVGCRHTHLWKKNILNYVQTLDAIRSFKLNVLSKTAVGVNKTFNLINVCTSTSVHCGITDLSSNDMTDFKKKQLWNDNDILHKWETSIFSSLLCEIFKLFRLNLKWGPADKKRYITCTWCEWGRV